MKIKEGYVKVPRPTTEINIWIQTKENGRIKAKILEAKQDSLGRLYMTVYQNE